jgi:pimeloyl-ACP methyl ester carboxylesterase
LVSCSNPQRSEILEKYASVEDGSRFIRVNGKSVHYRISGKGEKVILLLHGIVDSLHTWDLLVPQLEENFKVLRLDLPGFGLSDPLSLDGDIVESFTQHLKLTLDQLNLTEVYIVGNSLGGLMAWNFSLRYPSYTEKVALLSSGAFVQKFPWIFDISNPVVNFIVKAIGKQTLQQSLKLTGPFVPGLVGESNHEDFVNLQFERIGDLMTAEGNFKNYISILEVAYKYDFKDSQNIGKISSPLLVIHGQDDQIIPPSTQISKWKAVKPNATYIEPEGSAHMPQWEKPGLLANRLKAFFN